MREQEAAKEGLGFKSPVFLDPSKPNKALKASLQVLQAQPNAVFNLILILSFCHEFLLLYLRFLLIMVFFFFFFLPEANLVYYNQEHFGFLDKGNFGNHILPAVSIACTNRL